MPPAPPKLAERTVASLIFTTTTIPLTVPNPSRNNGVVFPTIQIAAAHTMNKRHYKSAAAAASKRVHQEGQQQQANDSTTPSSSTVRSLLVMALLAIQFAIQPSLQRHFTNPAIRQESMIVVCELFKLVFSALALIFAQQQQPHKPSSQTSTWADWSLMRSLTSAGLAAAIYSVQNVLTYIAFMQLDPLTYNLINQSKILFSAVFCYLVVGKRQSKPQMLALVIILVAVSLLVSAEQSQSSSSNGTGLSQKDKEETVSSLVTSSSPLIDFLREMLSARGIVPVVIAAVLSGLAASVSQYALQIRNYSSYRFSIELAIYSIFFLLTSLYLEASNMSPSSFLLDAFGAKGDGGTPRAASSVIPSSQGLSWGSFFHGWNWRTLVPIVSNAVGGICVGLVTKYAGSVKKGLAIVVGLVLSTALRYVLVRKAFSVELMLAIPLVSLSMWLHSAYPATTKHISMKVD